MAAPALWPTPKGLGQLAYPPSPATSCNMGWKHPAHEVGVSWEAQGHVWPEQALIGASVSAGPGFRWCTGQGAGFSRSWWKGVAPWTDQGGARSVRVGRRHR